MTRFCAPRPTARDRDHTTPRAAVADVSGPPEKHPTTPWGTGEAKSRTLGQLGLGDHSTVGDGRRGAVSAADAAVPVQS